MLISLYLTSVGGPKYGGRLYTLEAELGFGIEETNAGIGIPASRILVRYWTKKMPDCVSLVWYCTCFGIVSIFHSGTRLTGCRTVRHFYIYMYIYIYICICICIYLYLFVYVYCMCPYTYAHKYMYSEHIPTYMYMYVHTYTFTYWNT
jgi:hypothetical protein